MPPIADTFELTMHGLEAGLRVQHIAAFDLQTCSVADSGAAILADKSFMDFDQIPVRDNAGRIVGVLNRTDRPVVGNASDTMQQLDDSLLVPAEAPLISFIRLAGAAPYKLVLNENGIRGIVTRSDLLKLPVRLLAFAFVTHLETLMADLIRKKYPPADECWIDLLSEGRRKKVAEKREALKGSRLEIDLLELTDFCDKRQIVKKIFGLGSDFVGDAQAAEELRNQLAHAATFIENDAEAREFALKIQKAEKWIKKLQTIIHQKVEA
jgi:CBS domain-containing protein